MKMPNPNDIVPQQSANTYDWHHPAMPLIPSRAPVSDGAIRPRMSDDMTEGEADTDVLVADAELAAPPMYAVVMFNDDYTPMEFVVHILQSEFRHTQARAVEIMLNIHHQGRGIAGIYPKDIAETKAQRCNTEARKEGYPLLTQIEPSA